MQPAPGAGFFLMAGWRADGAFRQWQSLIGLRGKILSICRANFSLPGEAGTYLTVRGFVRHPHQPTPSGPQHLSAVIGLIASAKKTPASAGHRYLRRKKNQLFGQIHQAGCCEQTGHPAQPCCRSCRGQTNLHQLTEHRWSKQVPKHIDAPVAGLPSKRGITCEFFLSWHRGAE